ncbi:MAG: hypothetical protein RLZZ437_1019 [Pseudomonadota bacterium]|jgi:hypothetical protein
MDASEIKDSNTLQAWLETRPQSDSVIIVQRIALRAAPNLYRSGTFRQSQGFDFLTVLAILRCLLTAGVAGNASTPAVKSAAADSANAAAAAAYAAAADSAYAAAAAAAFAAAADAAYAAAVYAADARAAYAAYAFDARAADTLALQSGTNPLTLPLWHKETPPDWFTTAEAAMRDYWATNPTHWSFWQRWYDAATQGRPLDWQLQHDIALIPDAIWQSGPGPVAEAIAKIEAEHRKAAAPPLQTDNLPAPTDRTRNIKFVVKQVTLLHDLIEDEYEYLRGHNGGSATEQPLLDQQKATLQKLRDLVNAMLAALEGDPSPSTALTVVNETLPAVVTEAEALIDQGAPPQVSANITSLAASIDVLTKSGTPGTLATAIAFSEMAMTKLNQALTRRKKP